MSRSSVANGDPSVDRCCSQLRCGVQQLVPAEDETPPRQKLEDVMPRLENLPLERLPASHDVAHSLIRLARDAHRDEFAGPIQPRQVGGIALVMLPVDARPLRDQRRRNHVARVPLMSPDPLACRAAARTVLTLVVLFGLATACSGGAGSGGGHSSYQLLPLTSGRRVKLLEERRTTSERSEPALMLAYQTDVPLTDTVGLRAEAAAIWRDYESRADTAGVRSVSLVANAPPAGSRLVTLITRSYYFDKDAAGNWQARANGGH